MQKNQGNLFLLLVIGLAVLSGFIYKSTSYRLGLDIQGGIRLTYLVKATDKAGKPITGQQFQEVRKTLIGVLENRVTGPMSVAEASVIAKGENEVAIEIPGFADPNEARRILSTTAVLRVYWAKNVKTPKASYRPYDLGAKSEDPNNPNVDFVDSQGKPLSASEPKEKDEPDDAYSAYRAYRSLPLSERTVDKAYTKLTKAAGTAPAGWNEWKTKYKWDERAASYDGYQRMIEGWEILLEGADLAKAEPQIQGSNVQPSFKFQGEGSKRLADWCRQHQYDSDNLAFVLDGQVLSFAPLQEGAVLDGAGYIQGTFTQQYVNTLCGLLNGGALPATLEETSSQSLDPTIGKVALDQMLKAGMIAVGVIVLFMLAYYAFPGFVALIALGARIARSSPTRTCARSSVPSIRRAPRPRPSITTARSSATGRRSPATRSRRASSVRRCSSGRRTTSRWERSSPSAPTRWSTRPSRSASSRTAATGCSRSGPRRSTRRCSRSSAPERRRQNGRPARTLSASTGSVGWRPNGRKPNSAPRRSSSSRSNERGWMRLPRRMSPTANATRPATTSGAMSALYRWATLEVKFAIPWRRIWTEFRDGRSIRVRLRR